MAQESITVTNNETAQRYEARPDGLLALLEYHRAGDRIVYTHTEVPSALEGRGVGSALAKMALDEARAANLSIVPRCPFVAAYIKRHPEYASLVAPEHHALIT